MVLRCHAFLAAALKRLQRDVAALAPRHTAILRLLQLGLHVIVVGVHQIGHALHLRLRLSGCTANGVVHLHQLVDHQFPFGFPFHHGQQTFHYFVYGNLRYPILVFPYLIVLQKEHSHPPAHPVGAERDRGFLEPFRSIALEIMMQRQQHGVATRICRSLATLHQLFRSLLCLRCIGQSQGQCVDKVRQRLLEGLCTALLQNLIQFLPRPHVDALLNLLDGRQHLIVAALGHHLLLNLPQVSRVQEHHIIQITFTRHLASRLVHLLVLPEHLAQHLRVLHRLQVRPMVYVLCVVHQCQYLLIHIFQESGILRLMRHSEDDVHDSRRTAQDSGPVHRL